MTLRSAAAQAAAIAGGEISARELLAAVLDRYERHNPALNAVIFTQLDEANERARLADAVDAAQSWLESERVAITNMIHEEPYCRTLPWHEPDVQE